VRRNLPSKLISTPNGHARRPWDSHHRVPKLKLQSGLCLRSVCAARFFCAHSRSGFCVAGFFPRIRLESESTVSYRTGRGQPGINRGRVSRCVSTQLEIVSGQRVFLPFFFDVHPGPMWPQSPQFLSRRMLGTSSTFFIRSPWGVVLVFFRFTDQSVFLYLNGIAVLALESDFRFSVNTVAFLPLWCDAFFDHCDGVSG